MVQLSEKQRHVLSLVLNEKNVFIIGAAGTGKSALLLQIVAELTKKYSVDEIAVTAPHGNAAVNIQGVTLARFGGYGALPREDFRTGLPFDRILANPGAIERWSKTKVLVIDEISTLDGELLDLISRVAQVLRRNMGTEFGGMQVVLCGDFYQLPPCGTAYKWAFEAKSWGRCALHTVELKEIFRQKRKKKTIKVCLRHVTHLIAAHKLAHEEGPE